MANAENLTNISGLIQNMIASVGKYQFLIGWLVAIFAAWLAARPVWRQLTLLNEQSEFQARDLMLLKLADAERFDRKLSDELQDITSHFWATQFDGEDPALFEDRPLPLFNPHAAHTLEQNTNGFERLLKRAQSLQQLPSELDGFLEASARDADKLSLTFQAIHVPHSIDFDDPEFLEHNPSASKADAQRQAEDARIQVAERVSELEKSVSCIRKELRSYSQRLRSKIRVIETRALS
ncbi:MAG: hypothetical protein ACE360_04070 [Hyphomicrobiales bacterium]